MRVFDDLGFKWPRRSTLMFVAFAAIIVAFTAFALSWNGLSAFRSSANADPAPGPFVLPARVAVSPTPTPAPPSASQHATGGTATHSVKPVVAPKPAVSPHPKAKHPTKTKHVRKPTAAPTPKPTPAHTPKPKALYIHTPKVTHVPKRNPQYPPAGPVTTVHGVLAGAAGQNYVAR